ncbi:heme peroxidase [Coprinopsis sp. MPI-PUGE-AT-0042]|nr:heme peroxidase [Coprinopsis sp. MPI-PUGE-AT-0042]
MSVKRMSTLFRKKEKSEIKGAPAATVVTNGTNGTSHSNANVTNGETVASPTSPTSPAKDEAKEAEGMKALRDFKEKKKQGKPFDFGTSSIAAVLDLVRNKESIDDRKLFLEHALTFISRMEDGPLSHTLKNKIIQLFYNDLTHPSATSVGNKYAWRTADGSFNNIDLPDLGKAGMPYSRSVQQTHPLPINQMPDPGLLFDTLLKREGFVEHPGGLSALFFGFATLVIHSVFRTSHRDVTINETSSYVDLAPLYGNNLEDQDRIRVRDGRGLLYPDVFAEDRLLMLPPSTCALLVIFSRNHNYIARKLLDINERGHYVDPSKLSMDDPKQKKVLIAQDEEIFQTARLINCGWFGGIVFSDYFSSILGLVRDGNNWSLSPFEEMRMDDHTLFERGKGNVVSAEFNCLYRWHATTSRGAEKWTERVFDQIFPGKPHEEVSSDDFRMTAHKLLSNRPPTQEWVFGGIKRQADGSFRDEDLAKILHDATEDPAGAFRARGTPAVMRLNEVMGIEQSRKWGVCSLNDFRKYLGLKPYSTFLEWNSDPEIATTAELIYGDIDKLELYVGLQAEEAKPLVDGAGLCPGYTVSRAILSDAMALTRGDRHFTHDFTPYNLTAWGFQDCQRDQNGHGFGSMLGPLLLRTLPQDYSENSVYTFFAMMTPDSMKTNLTKINKMDQTPYGERARKVIKGKGFFPAETSKEQDAIRKALNSTPEVVAHIGAYFYETTKKTLDAKSFNFVGGKKRGVDLVKNVINIVPGMWLTDLAGVTVAKDETHFTADKLHGALNDIYSFIFLNPVPAKVMTLQTKVQGHLKKLIPDIKDNLTGTKPSIGGIMAAMFTRKKPQHDEVINNMLQNKWLEDRDVLTNALLAIMVIGNAEISLAAANLVDYFLGTSNGEEIHNLAVKKDFVALGAQIREALKVCPAFEGVYRISTREQIVAGRKFAESERIFLNTSKAHVKAEGAFEYLGEDLMLEILTQIIAAVFERPGLTRSKGLAGELQQFRDHTKPEAPNVFVNQDLTISEWPSSLTVFYNVA